MKFLSKILCGITLLSISGLVWTTCPNDQKENNRTGECRYTTSHHGSTSPENSLSSGAGWRFKRSLPVGAKKHGYKVVASVPRHYVRYGKKSERFEVRPGDCSLNDYGWNDCKTDRERSELTQSNKRQKEGDEYWYRWSIYLPRTHQNIYRTKLTYAQFHQQGCEPVFMFQEYAGGYWLNIQPTINNGLDDDRKLLDAKEFIGKWNDIVVHARWTKHSNGWFKIWVNGRQSTSYVGKTMTCKEVFFKYGIYRSFISRSSKSESVTTIAYYDGVVRSKSKEGMFDALLE